LWGCVLVVGGGGVGFFFGWAWGGGGVGGGFCWGGDWGVGGVLGGFWFWLEGDGGKNEGTPKKGPARTAHFGQSKSKHVARNKDQPSPPQCGIRRKKRAKNTKGSTAIGMRRAKRLQSRNRSKRHVTQKKDPKTVRREKGKESVREEKSGQFPWPSGQGIKAKEGNSIGRGKMC